MSSPILHHKTKKLVEASALNSICSTGTRIVLTHNQWDSSLSLAQRQAVIYHKVRCLWRLRWTGIRVWFKLTMSLPCSFNSPSQRWVKLPDPAISHKWRICPLTSLLMRPSPGVRGVDSRNEHLNQFSSTVPSPATRTTWTWSRRVMSLYYVAKTLTKRSNAFSKWTSRSEAIRLTGRNSIGSFKNARVRLRVMRVRGTHQRRQRL